MEGLKELQNTLCGKLDYANFTDAPNVTPPPNITLKINSKKTF
jgi:hypothetical protein